MIIANFKQVNIINAHHLNYLHEILTLILAALKDLKTIATTRMLLNLHL